MDVLRELQEIRAINARVEQLEREGADPAQIRRAMQVAIKPGENGLSYQTRVLLYSYASDLIAAAEMPGNFPELPARQRTPGGPGGGQCL